VRVRKPNADALLETADRVAQRRLRDAELAGGAREAAVTGYGDVG
jgi:hypothetical protein